MNIEWKINKKRGNFRPVLSYSISLNQFEKEMGLPAVRIESRIPKPPDAGWTHCWPDENERGAWIPGEFYLLMTPSYKSGKVEESIKLPWREDNTYPEVRESFVMLREAFERTLASASASSPMSEQGRLESSTAVKKVIAPAAAAERILKVVGGG